MQNLDNDMDELFRRAAEKYPLDVKGGAWDKVEKKLSVPFSDNVSDNKKAKSGNIFNSKSKLFFLLLLLFLITSFSVFMLSSGNQKSGIKTANETRQKEPEKEKFFIKDKHFQKSQIKPKPGDAFPNRTKKLTVSAKEKNYNSDGNRKRNNNKILLEKNASVIQSKDDYLKNGTISYEPGGQEGLNDKTENEILTKTENLLDYNPKKESAENLENDSTSNTKKAAEAPKNISKQKNFYLGFTADADFNKVKTTSFEGPAFGFGLMAGYQLHRRFFIETGLTWFQKNYYSLGNAFYEKGVSMPQGMVINNLKSKAKILEIPLKAGYFFYEGKKNKWFVATGASAYVMMNEQNSYNVTMNGTPEKMNGVYPKNTTNLPAVIFISSGLQQNITNSLKINIEPYLKLPITGIGVGKLPVTSAGIQIGISRNFK